LGISAVNSHKNGSKKVTPPRRCHKSSLTVFILLQRIPAWSCWRENSWVESLNRELTVFFIYEKNNANPYVLYQKIFLFQFFGLKFLEIENSENQNFYAGCCSRKGYLTYIKTKKILIRRVKNPRDSAFFSLVETDYNRLLQIQSYRYKMTPLEVFLYGESIAHIAEA
jgi:hypothetical protein